MIIGPITVLLLLYSVFTCPVQAEDGAEDVKSRTMEFNITIQANVMRICAGGRLYDLIEAESAGDGPSIRPYVVEAVDNKGQHLVCPMASESQTTSP